MLKTKSTGSEIDTTQADKAFDDALAADRLGKNAKKLAFICGLGDPTQTEKSKKRDSETGKSTLRVVGAKFQVLEPLLIPVAPPEDDFKDNPMSHNPDNVTWKMFEAGEYVYMTPFEYSLLLSQPEFNGVCLGGDRPVQLVCQYAKNNAKKLPRAILRAINKGDTVKDLLIEPVFDVEIEKDPITGQEREIRKVKPGFEKWEPFTYTKKAGRGRGSANNKIENSVTKVPEDKTKKYYALLGKVLPKEVLTPDAETLETYEDIMRKAKDNR